MYDFIIIGGGSVGMYLAIKLREKGRNVLILEKKKNQEKKICSGLVSGNFFDFFPRNACLLQKEFLSARIWIEDKKFDFKGKAYLFEREDINSYLFKKVKEVGVEIKRGKEAIKIEEKDNFVSVLTRSNEKFSGKVLAGCDGASSLVARQAKMPEFKRFLLGTIFYTKQEICEKEKDFPELFFGKNFPGFFGWRIPRKNCIEYGTALFPEENPEKKLKDFFKKRIKNFKDPLDLHSAIIPVFPRKRVCSKRIFLCGDAAGQIKSYTGGGLVYSFFSAKIAANVLDPNNIDLSLYEKEWRKELMKDIRLGSFIRKCYNTPAFIQKVALLFLKTKNNLDQDRPSSVF